MTEVKKIIAKVKGISQRWPNSTFGIYEASETACDARLILELSEIQALVERIEHLERMQESVLVTDERNSEG